ncbi:hypothetical protein SDC9_149727 [bioreactor metagenome]|uniref:Uncharacterized protein n=1 Tax=bioreactor metagenome TaxID=1076179 RepID=A0A645EKK2_9ZZZZ
MVRREGCDPQTVVDPDHQGERRLHRRIFRAGRRFAHRAAARHDHQHGRGTRRHDQCVPLRRIDPDFPEGAGPREGFHAARRRSRRGIRSGDRDRTRQRRAARRLPLQSGQHQNHPRAGRNPGCAGADRFLHQLQLPRPRDGGDDAQGPQGVRLGHALHRSRQPPGARNAGPQRNAGRHHRRRRAHPRNRLRTVYRTGAEPGRRHRFGAHLQPQLRRADRDEGRPGLSGQPRNGGRHRAHRRIRRSARNRRRISECGGAGSF